MKNTKTSLQSVDVYKTQKKMKTENDAVLPDYCSDISRVIKVEATPFVTSKKVSVRDGVLSYDISGNIVFNIIYVNEESEIEGYSFDSEFFDSGKTDVSGVEGDSAFAFVKVGCDGASCKVQSPRRVSVRADVSLDIDIKANKAVEYYVKGDESVEVIESECSLLRLVESKDMRFNVSQEIKLPKSCPEMERVLSTDVTLCLEGAKAGDGIVNFWGNAGALCVYLPESEEGGEIQSFYQPIEIKGTLELDEARGDMPARVVLSPAALEYEISSDSLGENRILKLDFSYDAQCTVSENSDIMLTSDIYGVGCEVSAVYDKLEAKKYLGTLKESTAIKEKFPLKKGINNVEGMSADVIFRDTYFEGSQLFANCRVELSGIGTGESEMGISESFDITVHLNLPSEITVENSCFAFDICQCAGFVDVRCDAESFTASFDLETLADIYALTSESYIKSVDIGECDKTSEASALYYYPTDGDSLWSVGKRYGVGIDALCKMNSITDGRMKRVMRVR